MTRPVGDLPPEVYWRRRIVALALVVLAVLVLFYLFRPLFTTSEPTPDTSPSPSPSPSPTETLDITQIRTCAPVDLDIIMSPSPRDFSAGSIPLFDVSIEHTGFTDCVLDTTTNDMTLLVTSGSDRVWFSGDCPADDLIEPVQRLMAVGDLIETTVSWPRIRSNEQCGANLPSPRAGTYHAFLTVQGIESNDTVFTLSD